MLIQESLANDKVGAWHQCVHKGP